MNYQELVEFIEEHNTNPEFMVDSMDRTIDKPRERNILDCTNNAVLTFKTPNGASTFCEELRDYIDGMEGA